MVFGREITKKQTIVIDGRFDTLRIDEIIVITSPASINDYCDLAEYVEQKNAETMEKVRAISILNDESFARFEQHISKSRKIKGRFLAASNSKVPEMRAEELLSRIKAHPLLKSLVGNDDKISITNEQNAEVFEKVLMDQILDSPTTNETYNVSVKKPMRRKPNQ